MGEASDGVADAVFGVLVVTGYYEAARGRAEFRSGGLVGLRIGQQPAWEAAAGLPIGFTGFPGFGRGDAPAGEYVPARGLTRVFVRGVLDAEADTGPVHLNPARL